MKVKVCGFRIWAALAAMVALPLYGAAEKIPLWPEGKIPDFDPKQEIPYLDAVLPERRSSDVLLVIAPGGSYEKWCHWEGKCARYFNDRGIATALLRYRTPRPTGAPMHRSAWQDEQRAIRVCRANAEKWKINPERIFFMGFSAGGNLTILAATSSGTPSYAKVDALDDLPCHVNGAIACYSAYVLSDCRNFDGCNQQGGNDLGLELNPAFCFDAKTPPMCFLHGDADAHSPMGSVRVYHKLRTMRIPAEIHIYSGRKHADIPTGTWHDIVWTWIFRNLK